MTGGRHLQVLQPSFLRWPLASEEAANLEETRGFYVEIEGTSARFPKNSIYIYIVVLQWSRNGGKISTKNQRPQLWLATDQTPSVCLPEFLQILQINPVKLRDPCHILSWDLICCRNSGSVEWANACDRYFPTTPTFTGAELKKHNSESNRLGWKQQSTRWQCLAIGFHGSSTSKSVYILYVPMVFIIFYHMFRGFYQTISPYSYRRR